MNYMRAGFEALQLPNKFTTIQSAFSLVRRHTNLTERDELVWSVQLNVSCGDTALDLAQMILITRIAMFRMLSIDWLKSLTTLTAKYV